MRCMHVNVRVIKKPIVVGRPWSPLDVGKHNSRAVSSPCPVLDALHFSAKHSHTYSSDVLSPAVVNPPVKHARGGRFKLTTRQIAVDGTGTGFPSREEGIV